MRLLFDIRGWPEDDDYSDDGISFHSDLNLMFGHRPDRIANPAIRDIPTLIYTAIRSVRR